MPAFGNLDDEARAELLCNLVVSQLIARLRTGEWLRTDHQIECTRIWLEGNGGVCDWIERAELGEHSIALASLFHSQELMPTEAELVAMFTDGWRLDFRAPWTQALHAFCIARLRFTSRQGGHDDDNDDNA